MRKVPNKIDPLSDTGLPAGYKLCEYLEGTGTQWIDTGYKPNNHTQLSIRGCWVSMNVTDTASCYTSWDSGGRGVVIASSWQSGCVSTSYICNYRYISGGLTTGVWFSSTMNINGKSTVSSDNGVYKEADFFADEGGEFQMNYSLPLFGGRRGGGAGYMFSIAKFRLAEFNILENDKLLAHFVPALDKVGVPCLYDTVRAKPFYNAGSGQFLYKLL